MEQNQGDCAGLRTVARGFFIGIVVLVAFAVIGTIAVVTLGIEHLITPAHARDNGQWGDKPASIREWFHELKQPDNPYMSCCGEADAFEADTFEIEGDHYVAVITDGRGVLKPGTRIPRTRAKTEVRRLMGDRPAKPKAPRIPPKRIKYHSDEERHAAKKRQRVEAYDRGKKERQENPLPTGASLGIHQYQTPDIPPELLADAERIKYLSHETIVGHLMGDPLPGRSALDKSRSGT